MRGRRANDGVRCRWGDMQALALIRYLGPTQALTIHIIIVGLYEMVLII